MKFHSQESLYLAFICIVIGAFVLYWYISPQGKIWSDTDTWKDKSQYYGPMLLFALAALITFVAAFQYSSSTLPVSSVPPYISPF